MTDFLFARITSQTKATIQVLSPALKHYRLRELATFQEISPCLLGCVLHFKQLAMKMAEKLDGV